MTVREAAVHGSRCFQRKCWAWSLNYLVMLVVALGENIRWGPSNNLKAILAAAVTFEFPLHSGLRVARFYPYGAC